MSTQTQDIPALLKEALEALEPFEKAANVPPIMSGRGENTRPRDPADAEPYDWHQRITWGAVRRARKAATALREAVEQQPPETVYKAVERALDECSAWIARPDAECTRKVAMAAGIAWSLHLPPPAHSVTREEIAETAVVYHDVKGRVWVLAESPAREGGS